METATRIILDIGPGRRGIGLLVLNSEQKAESRYSPPVGEARNWRYGDAVLTTQGGIFSPLEGWQAVPRGILLGGENSQ